MQKAFVQVSHPSLCVKGHVVMNLHIVSAEDLEQHGHRPSEVFSRIDHKSCFRPPLCRRRHGRGRILSGWMLQEPGKWVHSSMQHVLKWNASSDIQERDKHMLRESWRTALFSQFLTSASQLCNTRYCEQVCKLNRVVFADGDDHVRAVLAQGACRDQHLAVLKSNRHDAAQPAIQCKCGAIQVALEIGIIKCGTVRVFLETGHRCLTAAFSVGWGG